MKDAQIMQYPILELPDPFLCVLKDDNELYESGQPRTLDSSFFDVEGRQGT